MNFSVIKRLAVLALAGCAVAAAPAMAQDYNLAPTYGTVELAGGFEPDPYTVDLSSGGSIDVSERIEDCFGYIAEAPDVRLNFVPGSLPLIISVNSSADTTLVVNAPDGSWYCDDDSGEGFNPSLHFASPQGGQYDIWVGTYGSATLAPATLAISELTSQ